MKPIIFSTPMIKTILEGRKTQTRRVIKPQPDEEHFVDVCPYSKTGWALWEKGDLPGVIPHNGCTCRAIPCPYQPGDILWVRECVWQRLYSTLAETREYPDEIFYWGSDFRYVATDKKPEEGNWIKRPSIYMPREAARIFLQVKNVRVERLQEITEEDAKAEGAIKVQYCLHPDYGVVPYEDELYGTYKQGFNALWDSLNKKRGYGWDTNPYVWVIEFERISKEEAYRREGLG